MLSVLHDEYIRQSKWLTNCLTLRIADLMQAHRHPIITSNGDTRCVSRLGVTTTCGRRPRRLYSFSPEQKFEYITTPNESNGSYFNSICYSCETVIQPADRGISGRSKIFEPSEWISSRYPLCICKNYLLSSQNNL